jgi:hypothetical protein
MDVQIPTLPIGIVTLLGFFAPYAVAIVNRPEWSAAQRKWVALVVTFVLAAVALVIYYLATGEALPEWWALALLAIVVGQASYNLVLKPSAKSVELATTPQHRAS